MDGTSWVTIAGEISKLRDLGYDKATLDRLTTDFAELVNATESVPSRMFVTTAGMFDRADPLVAGVRRCCNPDCAGCNKRSDWRESARFNRAGEPYDVPATI